VHPPQAETPIRLLAAYQAIEQVYTLFMKKKQEKFDWTTMSKLETDLVRWLEKDE